MSSKALVRIVVGLSVALLTVACQPDPPPDDEFTIETPDGNGNGGSFQPADVSQVIEHLQAQQAPIGRVDIYNAENDPATRLGRPNQYVGKAIFHDTRHPLITQEGHDVISFQNSGGVIEIFASAADLESRITSLELVREQFPTAPPEYQYANGGVLLRLGSALTPEQAGQYETALASFQG